MHKTHKTHKMHGMDDAQPTKRSEPALAIENLTKRYGRLTAVDTMTLSVSYGEIYGLLGPNGAGKSTAIRVCLGLLNKDGGRVTILGMDSERDSPAIRRRTGYLPGDFGLIANITVRRHLRYLLSLSNTRSTTKMEALADRLELDLDRKTNELSKGNRQKVGIVQAFMADQDLIILDEPTGGLDPLMQQRFYTLVREEREAGKTIFLSSHILAEVEEICDRVAIIKHGRIVLDESIAALQNMTGKVLEVEFRQPVDPEQFEMDGVNDIEAEGPRLTMTVTANLDRLIKTVADHAVVNMNLRTYSLEQLFLRYYSDETPPAATAVERSGGAGERTGERTGERIGAGADARAGADIGADTGADAEIGADASRGAGAE